MIVEVPCGNLESVSAAIAGGADRIELCSALPLGGLTPSVSFLETVLLSDIQVFAMIRPREGDFVFSNEEFFLMLREIALFKKTGVKGIVSGILLPDGTIDAQRSQQLIDAARPLQFTFHRAFDLTANLNQSLETLIQIGSDRVLTSGGASDAFQGKETILNLIEISNGKIIIMPGGGIHPGNVLELVRDTGVKEIHLSGKKKKQEFFSLKKNIKLGNTDDDGYDITDKNIIREIKTITA
jgi:copper homeostasis protein